MHLYRTVACRALVYVKEPNAWYYNDGLLNKMADGPCPATNQQAWKDRSGAVAGSYLLNRDRKRGR